MWKERNDFIAAEWKCGNTKIIIFQQSLKESDEHIFSYAFFPNVELDEYTHQGEIIASDLKEAKTAIIREVKNNINAEMAMWAGVRQTLMDNGEW